MALEQAKSAALGEILTPLYFGSRDMAIQGSASYNTPDDYVKNPIRGNDARQEVRQTYRDLINGYMSGKILSDSGPPKPSYRSGGGLSGDPSLDYRISDYRLSRVAAPAYMPIRDTIARSTNPYYR